MSKRDMILDLVRAQGPVIPSDLVKQTKEDTFIIGAILSELVASNILRITSAKIGGSPLYYTEEQRPKLSRLRSFLNEKDQQTYDKLERLGVMRDNDHSPLERASLRKLKDFAILLNVTIDGQPEIFWKWHLLSNEDAREKIRVMLEGPDEPAKAEPPKPVKAEPEPKPAKAEEEPAKRQETPKPIKKPEEAPKKMPKAKPAKQVTIPSVSSDDTFFEAINAHLSEHGIKVVELSIIKPNSELELTLIIPTGIGDVRFYARARKKKKCTDADLAVAALQGSRKNLPVVFITSGEVTKKAKELPDYKHILIVENVS